MQTHANKSKIVSEFLNKKVRKWPKSSLGLKLIKNLGEF